MKYTDTVIIGGGQAGLAMSRCLWECGVKHVVHGAGLPRPGLRPGGLLRLPAQHGRSARSSPARPPSPEERRHGDAAGDRLEDNLNPVGRAYYGFSTMVCTPASLSQEGRYGLGAQAGEARLREVLTHSGFGIVRRAAETPFNLILEARP